MSPFQSGNAASSMKHHVVFMPTVEAEMVLNNTFKMKLQPEYGNVITSVMLFVAL